MFVAGKFKNDRIAFGGSEFIRAVVRALDSILIDANLHIVGGGQGQWKNSEREKGGGMHDGRRVVAIKIGGLLIVDAWHKLDWRDGQEKNDSTAVG